MKNFYSLRKVWDFSRLINQGKKVVNSEFMVFFLPNQLNNCRFGISIPRKLAKKASQRNYSKRQIRNIVFFFLSKENPSFCQANHWDLLVITRLDFFNLSFVAKKKSLLALFSSLFEKKLSPNKAYA